MAEATFEMETTESPLETPPELIEPEEEESLLDLRLLAARVKELEAKVEQYAATDAAAAQKGPKAQHLLLTAVRSLVAHLTEADPNWHQAAVHYAASKEEGDAAYKLPLFASSVVMVFFQCAVAVGVIVGTFAPVCEFESQCMRGQYCETGNTGRCAFCGETVPMPAQEVGDGTTLNHYQDENFAGFNSTLVAETCADPNGRYGQDGIATNILFKPKGVLAWCETCVHVIDMSVDMHTYSSHHGSIVRAMGMMDWAALIFASFIVAFVVSGELKDIQLVRLASARAVDAESLSTLWLVALTVVSGARRWIFLPALVIDVPTIVLNRGGDAYSVCLNTVAILFLLEIDNIAFAMGMSERMRRKVEDVGRVTLTDDDAVALVQTKTLYIILVVIIVLAGVSARWRSGSAHLVYSFLLFWIGGVVEAFLSGTTVADKAKGAGLATGAAILGLISFIGFFSISFV